MAKLLLGKEVNEKLNARITARCEALKARGVRSSRSPLKAACQLLTYSEFTVLERRGYLTITEAVPKEMFLDLRTDLERLSLASYFAQVAEVVSQEDSPNPQLLSLLLNCMYALGKLQKSQALVKAVFEIFLLGHSLGNRTFARNTGELQLLSNLSESGTGLNA